MTFKIKYLVPIFIALCYIVSLYDIILGYYSDYWPSTVGKIVYIDSKYREGYRIKPRMYGPSEVEKFKAYYSNLEYEYVIGDNKYTSTRSSYPDRFPETISFNDNKYIKVYYSNKFNFLSVLNRGYHFDMLNFLWFTSLAFFTIIYLIYIFLSTRLRKSDYDKQ